MSRKMIQTSLYMGNAEYCTLFHGGDFHIGNYSARIDGMEAFTDRVQTTKGPKGVFTYGDMIECIEPNDKRYNMCTADIPEDEVEVGQPLEPQMDITAQKKLLVKLMKPIAKHILGFFIGNHEAKLHAKGHRVAHEFLGNMQTCSGWRGKYMGAEADIKLTLSQNKGKYKNVYMTGKHGSSNAVKEDSKIKAVRNFLQQKVGFIMDGGKFHKVQAALSGHMHDLKAVTEDAFIPNYDLGAMDDHVAWLCITGDMLDATLYNKVNYAVSKGMKPSPCGWLEMIINREGKIVDVREIRINEV